MEPARRYLVWGAGGHGRVVADVIRAVGGEVSGFVDREPDAARLITDVAVLAEADFLAIIDGAQALSGFDCVALGIGDNEARLRCLRRCRALDLPAVIHPSAIISPSASVGAGSVIMPGAIVNAGARVGEAVIVNTGAIVEHDCIVDDGAHVSPGAVLAGGVHVGACAWIGASATVIQGRTIGDRATVGAGAVVIRDVSSRQRVVGVPARPLPPLESH